MTGTLEVLQLAYDSGAANAQHRRSFDEHAKTSVYGASKCPYTLAAYDLGYRDGAEGMIGRHRPTRLPPALERKTGRPGRLSNFIAGVFLGALWVVFLCIILTPLFFASTKGHARYRVDISELAPEQIEWAHAVVEADGYEIVAPSDDYEVSRW